MLYGQSVTFKYPTTLNLPAVLCSVKWLSPPPLKSVGRGIESYIVTTVNHEYFVVSDSLAYAKFKCMKIYVHY